MKDRLLISMLRAEVMVERALRASYERVWVELDVFGPGGVRVVIIQGLATFPHRG